MKKTCRWSSSWWQMLLPRAFHVPRGMMATAKPLVHPMKPDSSVALCTTATVLPNPEVPTKAAWFISSPSIVGCPSPSPHRWRRGLNFSKPPCWIEAGGWSGATGAAGATVSADADVEVELKCVSTACVRTRGREKGAGQGVHTCRSGTDIVATVMQDAGQWGCGRATHDDVPSDANPFEESRLPRDQVEALHDVCHSVSLGGGGILESGDHRGVGGDQGARACPGAGLCRASGVANRATRRTTIMESQAVLTRIGVSRQRGGERCQKRTVAPPPKLFDEEGGCPVTGTPLCCRLAVGEGGH